MKKIIIFISLCLLFFSCFQNGNQEPEFSLNGGWKLIAGEHRQPDGDIVKYPIGEGKHYMLYNDQFFMKIWQDTSKNASSIYPGFSGGTYNLTDDFLTGRYIACVHKILIGTQFFNKVKFKEDMLSIVPSDENGNLLEFGFFEQWEKIE